MRNLEQQKLLDAVYRDAVRTDPDNAFFSNHQKAESSYVSQHFHQSDSGDEDNVQKLINIVVIYILEHGEVSYTQGMTDILSPILFVMKNEADAYIAFATVVERIKMHFGQWCSGTLQKLQRFRHLCKILDPELYRSLTENVEEDVFVLFFGMVLIECRREFSFEDSFHLLETIWAGEAFIKDSFPSKSDLSHVQWAKYMTYESPEVLEQVFNSSGVPYSAVPLPFHASVSSVPSYPYSQNPSLVSYSPSMPVQAFLRRHSEADPTLTHVIAELHPSSISSSVIPPPGSDHSPINSSVNLGESNIRLHSTSLPRPVPPRKEDDQITLTNQNRGDVRVRSLSDSNVHSFSSQGDVRCLRDSFARKDASPLQNTLNANCFTGTRRGLGLNKHGTPCSFSHSESELYDSFSNGKVAAVNHLPLGRNNTEMSDMSSGTGSLNSVHKSSVHSSNNGKKNNSTWKHNVQESSNSRPSVTEWGKSTDRSEGGSSGRSGTSDDSTSGSSGPHSSASVSSPDTDSPVVVGRMTSTAEGRSLVTNPEATSNVDHSIKMPKKKVSLQETPKGKTSETSPSAAPTALEVGGNDQVDFSDYMNPELDYGQLLLRQESMDDGVVEHRGLITSVGHNVKSSVLSHYGNTTGIAAPLKEEVNLTRPQDREVSQHGQRMSSPRRINGTDSPIEYSNNSPKLGDSEMSTSARVTPMAFFDTMDKLARVVGPSNRGSFIHSQMPQLKTQHSRLEASDRDLDGSEPGVQLEIEVGREEDSNSRTRRRRANSELEVSLMSQLILTDEGAPRVTREESLSIPFHECYSLFICLSILVQNRNEIIQDGADFYSLSEILNAQAGMQDLDVTLRVAHSLYRTYRKYQEACFRLSSRKVDCWLDDTQ